MAKKRTTRTEAKPKAITADRAPYLYRLLEILGKGPQKRETLIRRLKRDVRSFYRDLSLLRAAGILVTLAKGRYHLEGDVDDAIARLPFPDPLLTLGEARQLARGRTVAHRKLKEQIDRITG